MIEIIYENLKKLFGKEKLGSINHLRELNEEA